jgi:hypothetical protein
VIVGTAAAAGLLVGGLLGMWVVAWRPGWSWRASRSVETQGADTSPRDRGPERGDPTPLDAGPRRQAPAQVVPQPRAPAVPPAAKISPPRREVPRAVQGVAPERPAEVTHAHESSPAPSSPARRAPSPDAETDPGDIVDWLIKEFPRRR